MDKPKDSLSVAELSEYVSSQYEHLRKANTKLRSLEEENAELKKKLQWYRDEYQKKNKASLTQEEELCQSQINELKSAGKDRLLTLNETKQLDLLVKNLYLIQAKNKKPASNKPDQEMSEEELVLLAAMSAQDDNT